MNEPFRVVLVFNLKPDSADEELRRSKAPDSFPSRLAKQPGFLGLELVKVSEERTLSLQQWRSPADWWAALEAVKRDAPSGEAEPILVSREFFAGPVVETRGPPV